MDCPECGYDVRGLPQATCPECGGPFDPDAAGGNGDAPIHRSVIWVSAVSLAWPLVIQIWAHLMLVAARIQLGSWPNRWGMHDPKGIPVVNVMHVILFVACLAAVPLMIAGAVGLAYGVVYRRRLTGCLIAAIIASWIATWLIGDRAEVWLWIMD